MSVKDVQIIVTRMPLVWIQMVVSLALATLVMKGMESTVQVSELE